MRPLKDNIIGYCVKFLLWVLEFEPNIATPTLKDPFYNTFAELNIDGQSQEEALNSQRRLMILFLKEYLSNAPRNQPIVFENLNSRLFLKYLLTIKKSNGQDPGQSKFRLHRTALFHLFRIYEVEQPPQLEKQLNQSFRGLNRTSAQQITNGNAPIKIGKDPLDFSLLRVIGTSHLKSSKKEHVFSHCFLLLCWNLMCRAGNCVSICYEHIEWKEDALCIYFAHMKNDQTGQRPRDPRHIYANPVMPEICLILALGIYLLCYNANVRGKLFPGASQYDRFRKLFTKLLENNCSEDLFARGLTHNDLGTHSLRKGASSYCSSGSTACPPSVAVHLGGVQDRYLRYEAAGDQYVGRTVSGLPLTHEQFATLPPFFKERNELLSSTIQECFTNLPNNLKLVSEFCLASVVYHKSFLVNTLPKTHVLFNASLFRNQNRFTRLFELVECRLPQSNDLLKPTGIPPHVLLI